jgi:hypothetical protein
MGTQWVQVCPRSCSVLTRFARSVARGAASAEKRMTTSHSRAQRSRQVTPCARARWIIEHKGAVFYPFCYAEAFTRG